MLAGVLPQFGLGLRHVDFTQIKPVYKFLTRYHRLHHKYPNKNYNVVFPLADYLLDTSAHATAVDREQMARLGFLALSEQRLSCARKAELVETKK